MDAMAITVEAKDAAIDPARKEVLTRSLEKELHDVLLFSPKVSIVEPNSLPRVEIGKTRRVFDERSS